MIIFPAIDLKDGVCVRLKKGMMEDATVFNTDPAAQAKSFAAQGFQRRKLPIRRRPVAWLFSGWNCVPARLARPTAAVICPP